MIRISVSFHGSVLTNRTLSSTGPLSVQLKCSYRLHASIKVYFVASRSDGKRPDGDPGAMELGTTFGLGCHLPR